MLAIQIYRFFDGPGGVNGATAWSRGYDGKVASRSVLRDNDDPDGRPLLQLEGNPGEYLTKKYSEELDGPGGINGGSLTSGSFPLKQDPADYLTKKYYSTAS